MEKERTVFVSAFFILHSTFFIPEMANDE